MKSKTRWLNKLYAEFFGYFWLPCPICGVHFGGHEVTGAGIMTSWGSGRVVCPNCVSKSEAYNQEWMKAHAHDKKVTALYP